MPAYRYTGPVPADFPTLALGRTLEPGDVVELEDDPGHPELELVKVATPSTTKARKRAADPKG